MRIVHVPTPEGPLARAAVTRLRTAPGWSLVVTEPVASYEVPWQRPLLELGIGAFVLLVLSLATAAILSARMRQQLDRVVLSATAFAAVEDDRADTASASSRARRRFSPTINGGVPTSGRSLTARLRPFGSADSTSWFRGLG